MQKRDTKSTIGTALRRMRLDRNLTLEQVGTLVDLHLASVQKIERGKVKPQDRTVYRILKAFPDLLERYGKSA